MDTSHCLKQLQRAAWLCAAAWFSCLGAVAADTPRLRVNGETLAGTNSPVPGVSAYLGIPFAKPPLAALRWSAPVAYRGHGGQRQAMAFAPACMQTMRILDWYRDMAESFGASREVFPDLATSEDCLYLNVWTPAAGRQARLPVLVYIHGGSNNSGWSYEPNYHGHALAAEGAVVVSVAYRLGVFGFFSHPDLTNAPAKANFGLWDQLLALRWVQRNIAAFGGDPSRVTVFGESAGAGDTVALMVSPLAQGLLHRAILQSGSRYGPAPLRSLAAEQARGTELARVLGGPAPLSLAQLRAIPAAQLLQHGQRVFANHYHAAVIDGDILREQLGPALSRRTLPLQQLLLGTNANEFYPSAAANATAENVRKAIGTSDLLDTPEALPLLVPDAQTDLRSAIDRLRTADIMACPAQYLAQRLSNSGHAVWMYQFSRVRDGATAAAMRAYHGAELPYVFGTHDAWLPTSDVDRVLSQQMMRYWVSFARNGDPNGAKLPRWPSFGAAEPRVLQLDANVAPIATPEPALCALYGRQLEMRALQ